MKKLFFIGLLILLFSCGDTQYKDLLPDRSVDVTINLTLPDYIGLQIPGGHEMTPDGAVGYGIKGIFIYRSNSRYYAYERACPHKGIDECDPMTFDGSYLVCPCDDAKFNFLNGGGSSTVSYRAREYHVEEINANTLRITNY